MHTVPTPHPTPADIPLALLIIFVAARLFREILERLGQPGIAGEILAGIIIGPHVLGAYLPSSINPAAVPPVLAELGVMFLLFRIGLEVKPAAILTLGPTAGAVAACGVALSFASAFGIASLWGHSTLEGLFIAAAIASTSVAVTAEVLASKGYISSRAGRTILAAAVLDDILGLIVLSLVSSYARGGVNILDLAGTAVLAGAFTLFVALWGHRAVGHAVPRLQQRMRAVEAQFTLSMGLLFSLAVLAVWAGVAAIIGAFLAGMALSETVDERLHTMTAGVSELLVPFFLAGIGMSLDPTVFRDPGILVLALVLLIVAILAKLIGCGLGAISLGHQDAMRVGAGMVPRGEVGMVVAGLGRKMGLVSDPVFGIIVFLSVATALLAPPMIRFTFERNQASEPSR